MLKLVIDNLFNLLDVIAIVNRFDVVIGTTRTDFITYPNVNRDSAVFDGNNSSFSRFTNIGMKEIRLLHKIVPKFSLYGPHNEQKMNYNFSTDKWYRYIPNLFDYSTESNKEEDITSVFLDELTTVLKIMAFKNEALLYSKNKIYQYFAVSKIKNYSDKIDIVFEVPNGTILDNVHKYDYLYKNNDNGIVFTDKMVVLSFHDDINENSIEDFVLLVKLILIDIVNTFISNLKNPNESKSTNYVLSTLPFPIENDTYMNRNYNNNKLRDLQKSVFGVQSHIIDRSCFYDRNYFRSFDKVCLTNIRKVATRVINEDAIQHDGILMESIIHDKGYLGVVHNMLTPF